MFQKVQRSISRNIKAIGQYTWMYIISIGGRVRRALFQQFASQQHGRRRTVPRNIVLCRGAARNQGGDGMLNLHLFQ
jgi:hypothetical protein